MGKWTYFATGTDGDNMEWNNWVLVDPEGERHNEYRYGKEADVAAAAEILNRHAPGQEYVTVCFAVRVDPSTRRQLSILDNGWVELDDMSFAQLTQLALNGQSVFGVAEVGCPNWAERAGADPELWEN